DCIRDPLVTGVQTCALPILRVLGLAGREADLAHGGRLLVAEVPGERHPGHPGRPGHLAVAARRGRRPDLRQHGPRDAEEAEQLEIGRASCRGRGWTTMAGER